MLWLGNTAHLRESDWHSKSGYLKRYAQARSTPELRSLIGSVPNYATWSAADYGAPNAGNGYSHREIAEESFRAFWPQPTQVSALDGIATRFRYADVDFFLLDTHSYRNNTPGPDESMEILGTKQIEWLRQELVRSTATFKIIAAGAPILNPAKTRTNLSYAEREHRRLLQMFRDEAVPGLFSSAAANTTESSRASSTQAATTYSTSPWALSPRIRRKTKTSSTSFACQRPAPSSVTSRSSRFTGPEEDRQLTIRVMDANGDERWNRTIPSSLLSSKGK